VARYTLMDLFRARSRHEMHNEALNEPIDDYLDIFESSDARVTDAKVGGGKRV
jgi:hypothetical protein